MGALLNTLVGVIIGFLVGQMAKLIEFRFSVLQKASTAYMNAMMAIRDYQVSKTDLAVPVPGHLTTSPEGTPFDRALKRADRARVAIGDAISIRYLVRPVFGQTTRQRWEKVIKDLRNFEMEDREEWTNSTHGAWEAFADGAAEECWFPRWAWLRSRTRRILRAEEHESE